MPTLKAKSPLGNLPASLSTFIGRERELAEVSQLLSAHRLVTFTGAGGSGKTCLSLKTAGELVNEFEDGFWFIELASISDGVLIPQTVASTLSLREQAGRSLMDILLEYI
jgi:predicted ATPase